MMWPKLAIVLILGGLMHPLATKFKDLQAIPLDTMPGISALEWTPQGVLLTADNVAGLYRWDMAKNELQPLKHLLPSADFSIVPKSKKPDFEAATLYQDELWLFGSGSLNTQRNDLIRYHLTTQTVQRESLNPWYSQIAEQGLEVNIEGAATIGDYFILANRGHQGFPYNHLLWFKSGQLMAKQQVQIPVQPFTGISALAYEASLDRLWFTATTEETSSVYEDGAIGDSYLGWVDGISDLQNQTLIQPTQCFNLTEWDQRFAGQKIEGLSVSPTHLLMGSDNDGKKAYLFVLTRQ